MTLIQKHNPPNSEILDARTTVTEVQGLLEPVEVRGALWKSTPWQIDAHIETVHEAFVKQQNRVCIGGSEIGGKV